ncbi:MAG TPA: ABC transporter permease [Geobacteraceae bacterium]|jgi:NitT/TauT family transport system permease protein|nr:ABC transporter permease [Geobacteraceae bacterium]
MKDNNAKETAFYVLLFYVLLLSGWQIVFKAGFIPDYLFPSPAQVGNRLWELGSDGYLFPSIRTTLLRMVVGYVIGAAIGLNIGLLMGVLPIANQCLKSLLLGLQTLPTAAWVPISLLLFGLSDHGIYFVIIMSSVPAIAIATSSGILHISPLYLRAAKTLGTRWYGMPHRVILPAAFPAIVTGLKLGWTLGWHGGVSAELIKSSVGLGFLLYMGRELNDAAQVIGIMVVTILFGVLLDRFCFGIIEQHIRTRWGFEKRT